MSLSGGTKSLIKPPYRVGLFRPAVFAKNSKSGNYSKKSINFVSVIKKPFSFTCCFFAKTKAFKSLMRKVRH